VGLTEDETKRVHAVAAYLQLIICMEKLRHDTVTEAVLGAIHVPWDYDDIFLWEYCTIQLRSAARETTVPCGEKGINERLTDILFWELLPK
jgi:hypothetical protein